VTIPSPNSSANSGPQTPTIASVANGSLPANAYITTVNGINVGPLDNCSVAELLSNGNGVTSMRGTAPPPAGGVNDQVFAGNESAVAMQQNGPTPVNTEAQPLGPDSAAVLTSNMTPAGSFSG